MPGIVPFILNLQLAKERAAEDAKTQELVRKKMQQEIDLADMKFSEMEASYKAEKAKRDYVKKQIVPTLMVPETSGGEQGQGGYIKPGTPASAGPTAGLNMMPVERAGMRDLNDEQILDILSRAEMMFPSPGKSPMEGYMGMMGFKQKAQEQANQEKLGEIFNSPIAKNLIKGIGEGDPDSLTMAAQIKQMGGPDLLAFGKEAKGDYSTRYVFNPETGEQDLVRFNNRTGEVERDKQGNPIKLGIRSPAERERIPGIGPMGEPGFVEKRKDLPYSAGTSAFVPTGPIPLQMMNVEGPEGEQFSVPVNPYMISKGIQTKPSPLYKPISPDDLPKYRNEKGQSPSVGISPAEAMNQGFKVVSTDEQKKLFNVNNIDAVLNQIDSLGKDLFKESGLFGRLKGSAKSTYGVLSQNDPKVVQFLSFSEGTLPMLIRAMGEVGNLSEFEQQRGMKLIPKIYPIMDTKEVYEAKINGLKEFFGEVRKRASQQNKPSLSPKGETKADPLGLRK